MVHLHCCHPSCWCSINFSLQLPSFFLFCTYCLGERRKKEEKKFGNFSASAAHQHSFIHTRRAACQHSTGTGGRAGSRRISGTSTASPRSTTRRKAGKVCTVLLLLCCYSIIHNSSIPTHNILPEGTWKYCCLLLMMKNGPFFILFIQYFLKIGT